jgi:hypothetical protein
MTKSKSIRGCEASTRHGMVCQAAAVFGSSFCYFHDPARANERKEAQASGGRRHQLATLTAASPDVRIEDSGDVVALISVTINQVRKGSIDPRVANAVGYLANLLLKALENSDLEKRIESLEAILFNPTERSGELSKFV